MTSSSQQFFFFFFFFFFFIFVSFCFFFFFFFSSPFFFLFLFLCFFFFFFVRLQLRPFAFGAGLITRADSRGHRRQPRANRASRLNSDFPVRSATISARLVIVPSRLNDAIDRGTMSASGASAPATPAEHMGSEKSPACGTPPVGLEAPMLRACGDPQGPERLRLRAIVRHEVHPTHFQFRNK